MANSSTYTRDFEDIIRDIESGAATCINNYHGKKKEERKKEQETPTNKNVSRVDITDPAIGTAYDMYHNGAQIE